VRVRPVRRFSVRHCWESDPRGCWRAELVFYGWTGGVVLRRSPRFVSEAEMLEWGDVVLWRVTAPARLLGRARARRRA
jgi:hypothetical protein